MKTFKANSVKKASLAASTLTMVLFGHLALAGTYSPEMDQKLANNEDRYLSVTDNSFMLSPSEPESLVYRTQGGEGSIYERFTVVMDSDVQYLKMLKPGTNYDCQFKDTASYRYGTTVSSYRILGFGIACVAK